MSVEPLVQEEHGSSLYRKMRVSQGGIMLLVRLHADLSEQPVSLIRDLVNPSDQDDLTESLSPGSRLSITYHWLERQFGRDNANRAVAETASELLRFC